MSDIFRLHCDATAPVVASPLSDIIVKRLEKRPESRYQTFGEAWHDLLRSGKGGPRKGNNSKIRKLRRSLQRMESHEQDAREWSRRKASLRALGDILGAIHCFRRALEMGCLLSDSGRLERMVLCSCSVHGFIA